jgi:zinc/manganese transport system permease protein
MTAIASPGPLADAVLGAIGWQPEWWDVLQAGFMRHAFIAGALVAVAAGLLGYFVVVRQHAFAAHALAHIGFPGATLAVLIGLPVTLGLAVFCVGGGLAIGALGKRVSEREVATGTILAFATGLGVLFNSMASRNTGTLTSILFGNLLAVSVDQLLVFAGFTVVLVVALMIVARPLMFASVNPRVAEAKGVPVRFLSIVFLVLLALVVTMAVQVVGTLLLFALVVTPAATALAITARPGRVCLLSGGIALGATWLGLVVATMFDLPPSFVIVTLVVIVWGATMVATRERRRRPDDAPLDPAHHH